MEVWKGGAWRTIRTADAYVNGAWRALQYGEAYIDGAWRTIVSFVQTLTLAISPSSGFWDASGTSVPAGPYTATPSGGAAPFTYAWTKLSGDSITIDTPSSATTSFTASGMALGESRTAAFRCTVTDTLGSTAHADITLTLARSSGTGGA